MIDLSITRWPRALAPKRVERKKIHPVNMGPEVLSGPPQSVISDAGRWRLEYKGMTIYGDKLLTFRALMADLCAPIKNVIVPLRDYRHTPRTRAGLAFYGALSQSTAFSDDATFSDDTAFSSIGSDFIVASNVAERSPTMRITAVGPASVKLTAGNFISLDDRSYVVTKIFPSVSGIPNQYDISIWPYLRYAHKAGEGLNTEDPVLNCTIDPKMIEMLDQLDHDFMGEVDLAFVEAKW